MLRPIGDRVLIKPEEATKQTESGLHLVEDWKPENTGTVVAVGESKHPLRAEAEQVAGELEAQANRDQPYLPSGLLIEARDLLMQATKANPQVAVGDLVVFGWNVGQEIFVDAERYLLMKESDISAVLEGA